MMAYKYLAVGVEDAVAVVSINRPPANSLDKELIEEMEGVVDEISADRRVRAVVISSALDRFFAAGADIKSVQTFTEAQWDTYAAAFHRTYNKIERMPKPAVAAISGHALGGGCELALVCDFRFMAEGPGRIGLPEVTLGLLPGGGGVSRLPRMIGRSRAAEMLITGRALTAQEALSVGLVHRVYSSPEEVREKSLEFAKQLAQQATVSIGWIKKCIVEGMDKDLQGSLNLERQAIVALAKTEDAKEGLAAFVEKRLPIFKGN